MNDALQVIDTHVEAVKQVASSPAGEHLRERLNGALDALRDVRESIERSADTRRRTWTGEAKAAFDQALSEAGNQAGFPSPDFWVSRAQAAAAIATAEQATIANLIAWKALQAARAGSPAGSLTAGGGDAVTERIEEGLGIA